MIGKRKEDVIMKEKKAYWEYDRFDKRTNVNYVNVNLYDVDAIDENGFTNAHWEIHAGSVESAINYINEHPEEYDVGCNEHLEASPVFFHETAYPMPFEF